MEAGQRVGVVGRTGAGKSSLLQALFSMHPLDKGAIFIDGTPVVLGREAAEGVASTRPAVSKSRLRGCLSIIPQDPTLFAESVRDNLSAGIPVSDSAIWDACDRCGIAAAVRSLPGGKGLDTLLDPGNPCFR